jgi:hypothetical protein
LLPVFILYQWPLTAFTAQQKRVRLHVFERRKIQCSTFYSVSPSSLRLLILEKVSEKWKESIGNNRDTLPYCYTSLLHCDCYCFRNTIWNYFSTAQGYLDRPFNCFGKHLGMSIPSFLVLFYLFAIWVCLHKYTHLNMTGSL